MKVPASGKLFGQQRGKRGMRALSIQEGGETLTQMEEVEFA